MHHISAPSLQAFANLEGPRLIQNTVLLKPSQLLLLTNTPHFPNL